MVCHMASFLTYNVVGQRPRQLTIHRLHVSYDSGLIAYQGAVDTARLVNTSQVGALPIAYICGITEVV